MTDVITRDGQQISMPAEEAQAAFLRGEVGFAPGSQQVTIGTQTKSVDVANLRGTLQLGATLASDEAVAQIARVEEWDSTAGAMATGALGAANALTLGLVDVAATQILGEEYTQEARAMREANPDAHLVGQIGGEVLGVLGSGGLGALAKGGLKAAARTAAITPAGLATRAALGAEGAIGNILGRGVIAKGLSTATGAAVETSIFEMGRALSDASIQEGDHSAEEIMSRMGEWAANDLPTTALIGGGIGGVFGLTFAGGAKALRGRRSAAERAAGRPAQKEIFLDKRIREAINSDDVIEGLSELGEEARTIAPKGGDITQEVSNSFKNQKSQMLQAKKGLGESLTRALRSTGEVLGLTKVHTANINNVTRHLSDEAYNGVQVADSARQFYADTFDTLGLDKKMVKGLQGQKKSVERQLAALDRLDDRAATGFRTSVENQLTEVDKAIRGIPKKAKRAAAQGRAQLKKSLQLNELQARERTLRADGIEMSPLQQARKADLLAQGAATPDVDGGIRDIIKEIRKTTGGPEAEKSIKALEDLQEDILLQAGPAPASRTTLNAELNSLEAQLLKRGQVEGIDAAEKTGLSNLSLLARESRARMDEILAGNINDPQVAARAYTELDVLNRRVGRIANENSHAPVMVKDVARQMHEALRKEMLDKSTWGKGLTSQRERLNNAWAASYDDIRGTDAIASRGKGRRLTAFDDEGNRLVNSSDVDPFTRAAEADTKKVDSFMNRIGEQVNGTQEKEVLRWVSSQKNLIKVISETTGEISPAQAKIAIQNLDDVRNAMMAGARTKVQADAFIRSMGAIGKFASMVRGLSPSARGVAAVADPLIGGLGAAGAEGLEMAIAHGITSQTGQAMLSRLRNRGASRVSGSVTSFLAKISSSKGIVRAARVRATAIPAQFGSGKDEKNRFKYGATLVRDFQEDAQAAVSRGINAMGPMATVTPNTSAMFGSRLFDQGTFLAQKLPKLPSSPAFGKDDTDKLLDRVSRSERAKFLRYFDAIGNPVGVLDDLSEGRVTREAVQALEAGWPLLYKKVSSEIQTQLATTDANIPFTTMVQLSQLFQIPVHPALQGNRIASIQQITREASTPQRSQSAIAPSRAVAPDMAAEFATRSEQIAGKVRG